MRVALAYAERRIPVFPLAAGGKKPLTPRGHLDATTDRSRITAWWNRWPDANIGVPTGKRSGLTALDVDAYKPGAWRPEDIEARLGSLPETLTARTGRGGYQFVYRHPPEANRNGVPEGQLGAGVGIKADGGYIVVAPSATVGAYEWIERRPPADAPEWIAAALRRPPRAAGGASSDGSGGPVAVSVDPGGPPIPDGRRNAELTRIAGRLHDGSRGIMQLEADLSAINAARCEPPLPDGEVRGIARSIGARAACRAAPATSAEVRDALEDIETELWRRDRAGLWRGLGGKSERDTYAALIVAARNLGTRIPAGIRVSIGLRPLARAAAVSKRAMLDYRRNGETRPGIISRLKRRGLIRSDSANRAAGDAGAIVLLMPDLLRASFPHSSTGGRPEWGGETLRAPRLRHSAPRFDRVGGEIIRTTISRLGKTRGAVIDHLQRAGGRLALPALCAAVSIARPRDLRRRILPRLIAAAVVECSGDTVSLTPGWIAALEREREIAGEIAADRRDAARHALERDAYRAHRRRATRPTPIRPAPGPAPPRPDGFIGELSRLPVPDPPAETPSPRPPAAPEPALTGALREVMRRWPDSRNANPYWFAATIWAYDLLPERPPDDAVADALAAIRGAGVAA